LRPAAFTHFVSRKPPVARICVSESISAMPEIQAAADRVEIRFKRDPPAGIAASSIF